MSVKRKLLRVSVVSAAVLLPALMGVDVAMAAAATDLKGIADNVKDQIGAFANLMITIAYLAGVGFTISAVFKFKQHKDNPTQVPIGTPFSLLGIGVVLMFLPGIFKPAAKSILGTADVSSSMTGTMTKTAVGE
jgi:intracellular multiplication protein IcmD